MDRSFTSGQVWQRQTNTVTADWSRFLSKHEWPSHCVQRFSTKHLPFWRIQQLWVKTKKEKREDKRPVAADLSCCGSHRAALGQWQVTALWKLFPFSDWTNHWSWATSQQASLIVTLETRVVVLSEPQIITWQIYRYRLCSWLLVYSCWVYMSWATRLHTKFWHLGLNWHFCFISLWKWVCICPTIHCEGAWEKL